MVNGSSFVSDFSSVTTKLLSVIQEGTIPPSINIVDVPLKEKHLRNPP